MWPFKKNRKPAVCEEALAAKIQSEIEQKTAEIELVEAQVQAEKIAKINKRNHFSEALTHAFKERHA